MTTATQNEHYNAHEPVLFPTPAAAVPVQTVRPRVPPGCRPRRRAGAARGAARQRPGCDGAGGGGCWGGAA